MTGPFLPQRTDPPYEVGYSSSSSLSNNFVLNSFGQRNINPYEKGAIFQEMSNQ